MKEQWRPGKRRETGQMEERFYQNLQKRRFSHSQTYHRSHQSAVRVVVAGETARYQASMISLRK